MIGERIHNYEINAHLGQGGMGNVFKATDGMLGREVALKMLHPQLTVQPQFLERFKKEARILAQLLHPNIAVIYNFIEQGGNHFMVMEYVEGTSLDELLKVYRALPAQFVVPVFIQALEGLQHAHRKNIFHRDVKPANLMLTSDATLKLMDFGIAKVAGEQKMTQVNKIVGTIEFMAPELIEGKDASALSDIYSMGATLYELISGKIPFEGDTDYNIMQSILKAKVKPPERLNPSIPKALNDIVLRALDKNPANRYPNAAAFQQALIAAFPQYRYIDMQVLKKAQETVYATKLNIDRPQLGNNDNDSMETRLEQSARLTFFEKAKRQILANKKLSAAALLLLVLLVSAVIIIATYNPKPPIAADAKNDSTKTGGEPVMANIIPAQSGGSLPVTPKTTTLIPVQESRLPVSNEILQEEPVKKQRQKKSGNNETGTPVQKTVEKNTEPAPPPAPVKKDIRINSTVTVNLALSGMPDMNQKKKETQQVSFTVTRPVYYEGVLIIRQGARAGGTLTIGRVRTDISIDYVEGANGARIPLSSEKEHGRRSDIESNKIFNAVVRPGTNMKF